MAPNTAVALQPTISDLQKKTAQGIVNIFETGRLNGDYGNVTLLAGDTGHLTYGRSQTTLASGNLFLLIKSYCDASAAQFAQALAPFLTRVASRDLTLDHDVSFRQTLKDAGNDPMMRDTQDAFFDRVYWSPALQSARNTGLSTGLGTTVVYDSHVHGSWPLMRDKTNAIGAVSKVGEKKWVTNYIATRRDWLATHSNELLHRCVYRMDSLSDLIQQKKWELELPMAVRGVPITEQLLASPAIRVSADTTRLLKLETPYMVGDDVVTLQSALKAKGLGDDADGIYGPLTEARVRQFQLRNSMKADGIVGPATRAALGI